jgi:predicted metal-binding membrane protein
MRPLQVSRQRRDLVVILLLAAGVAWWVTADRMAGMDAGPGTDLGTVGWFIGVWVVMMAAMMLPSFAPTLAAYTTATHRRAAGRGVIFTCGYLLTWGLAGLAAYGLFALGKWILGSQLAWHGGGGRWVAAGVLAVAAVYELLPVKRTCLRRCRGEPENVRRDGAAAESWSAAFTRGVRSGGWCLGCSWALMAALFALGVMSLGWMVLIAALVAIEKLGPWPTGARIVTAVVLGALAIGILAAPHDVPGLVVPSGRGMQAMGMHTAPTRTMPMSASHAQPMP